MRTLIGIVAALLIWPVTAFSAGLDEIAKAMGADKVKTIEFTGSGFHLFRLYPCHLNPPHSPPFFKWVVK